MSKNAVRSWSIVASIVCGMSAFATHADDAKTVQAVWKEQEIKFYFQPGGGSFSCDGTKRKVDRIIKALGVVDGKVSIDEAGCGANNGERQPLISLQLRHPVDATQTDTAGITPNQQPFAATWRRVSLSRGRMGLEGTDCALVDQLRQVVLPKFGVRIVDASSLDCRDGSMQTQPRLMVEALIADK